MSSKPQATVTKKSEPVKATVTPIKEKKEVEKVETKDNSKENIKHANKIIENLPEPAKSNVKNTLANINKIEIKEFVAGKNGLKEVKKDNKKEVVKKENLPIFLQSEESKPEVKIDPLSIFFPDEITVDKPENAFLNVNPRDNLGTPEEMEWLEKDIAQNGLEESIRVVETGNPLFPYRLFHGKRRLTAIRNIINKGLSTDKIKLVSAKIIPVEEATIINELICHGRLNSGKRLEPLEEGKLYFTLEKEGKLKRSQIAEMMNKTQSHISAMVLLHTNLPEEIKDDVRNKEISGTTALFAAKKIENKEDLKAVLKEAKTESKKADPKGKVTQQAVSNAIDKLKVDPKARSKRMADIEANKRANREASMSHGNVVGGINKKPDLPAADRYKDEKENKAAGTIQPVAETPKTPAAGTFMGISTMPIDLLRDKLAEKPTKIEKIIIENMINFLDENIELDEMLLNIANLVESSNSSESVEENIPAVTF